MVNERLRGKFARRERDERPGEEFLRVEVVGCIVSKREKVITLFSLDVIEALLYSLLPLYAEITSHRAITEPNLQPPPE
jgi:hypothetical protein